MTLISGRNRLTCDQILRRLDDYLDRALSLEEERLHRIALPPGLLSAVSARLNTVRSDGGPYPSRGGS